jgi:hypothetical protein
MARKAKRTYGIRRGSRKVGKRVDWFWEAYWTENGKDVVKMPMAMASRSARPGKRG